MNNIILDKVKLENGITINFAAKGDESQIPTIFLHGYVDSWRSFSGVLSELSPEFHCIAIDLRGHGDSDKPASGYGMSDFTNDLVLFMNTLGLKQVNIVGHSMGSFIAQSLAANCSRLIERLILISSAPSAADNKVLQEIKSDIDALRDPVDRNFVASFQAPANPISKEALDMIISESMKVPARVWQGALSGLLEVNHRPLLRNIAVPTLIIWGKQDGIFLRRDQEELLAEIGDSRLKEYDAGHALHWEQPSEVASDLKEFLNS